MNATLAGMIKSASHCSSAATHTNDVTALILCGGGAQRMGGVDKPLEIWRRKPLLEHVLARLPTHMPVLISANRNLKRYRRFGYPVFADDPALSKSSQDELLGPLAGIASAYPHLHTKWLYVIPGDAPLLPPDLPGALKSCCNQQAATASCVHLEQRQPLPLLVNAALLPGLTTYLQGGGRSVGGWLTQLGAAELKRSDAPAFANFNTPEDFSRA